MKNFLLGRAKGLIHALKGMFLLLKTEHSIITQFSFSMVLVAVGFYFNISRIDWIIQLSLTGVILAAEGLNTAIEKMCDFIHPDFNDRIGFIKDIAAGAVSFIVVFALIAIAIVYYPYLFKN